MRASKGKFLAFLLIAVLLMSVIPTTAIATTISSATASPQDDLIAAIEAIPEGGSGEITLKNITMQLSIPEYGGIYFENKDITFNLENAQLSTGIDEFGGYPVIYGYGANITINADENSSISAQGSTYGAGVVSVNNSTDWNSETKTYEKDFTLTINGGKYTCAEGDSLFAIVPGTKVAMSDVVCNGKINMVDMSGVDVTTFGELTINSGKFSNDISAFAATGKWCGKQGENWYVRDKEYTDTYNELLSGSKLVFDYTKPSSTEDSNLWLAIEEFNMQYYEDYNIYLDSNSFNADFTKCELGIFADTSKEEFHTVDVVWNYDSAVKEIADKFVEKFPTDRKWFNVTDLELVNYWVNSDPHSESEIDSLANYSGELRALLENSNFLFTVENRAGADDVFYTERIGSAKLIHDGKVYFSSGMLGARAEHAIYVPESTGDTADELIAAAQKRIDDYIGKNKVKITLDTQTVSDYYDATLAKYDSDLATARTLFEAESAKPEQERDWFAYWEYQSIIDHTPTYKQSFIDSFKEDGDLYFLNSAVGGYLFKVSIGENEFRFIILKDDDKLQTPSFTTVDLNTKVEINSASSEVPLDTVAEVEKLTSGTEYERVIKILDVEENETFDIKLYSTTRDKYVTKLENGKFQVKIPVPEKLEGKSLIVYYVNENDRVIEYQVTVKDGYATFITDHFSIYTLAVSPVKTASSDTTSPKTGYCFNITAILTLLLASSMCLLGAVKHFRKKA